MAAVSVPLATAAALSARQQRPQCSPLAPPISQAKKINEEKDSSKVWDANAQQFHGGQDWAHLPNFVEDFSVTTNALGTPARALARAREAISTIHHYPPADFEPAITDLATWLWQGEPGGETAAEGRARLLLGNGASELIDLVIRDHVPPTTDEKGCALHLWRPGAPNGTQYKEYERSAQAAGYQVVSHSDSRATITSFVNPNNPTGSYHDVETIKRMIEDQCPDGSHVIVDESMQPWLGPHWRCDSLIAHSAWVAKMVEERGIHVFVMHSWTKIWSCTGIRLGSVVAPSAESLQRIKKRQVPWSVNTMALEFLSEVVKDEDYMRRTWEMTPQWRQQIADKILAMFPAWQVHGKSFLSWLWVDTGSEADAAEAVRLAKSAGTPVRSGAPGYELPTMVRVAVREPHHVIRLLNAWEPLQRKLSGA